MKCYKCSGIGSNKSDDKVFCNNCFCEIVERRVRKEIRMNQLFQKNDKVQILDDGTEKSALNKYLLKNIIKDPTIKIDVGKTVKKGYDKIVLPWSLDDEINDYLKNRFEKKIKSVSSKNMIKPLVNITRDEAITFARIKKLKYKESEMTDLQKMIDTFDKRYPGTKFGILKTIRNTR